MKRTAGVSLTSTASASSSSALLFWKIFQVLFWFVGIGLLLIMLFLPALGVTLFWNILIPAAPALLVIGTGVWRNICPLSTTGLIPDRLGFSKKKKLSSLQQQKLNLIGVIALFLIIPLRHVVFDTNGQATAFIIIFVGVVAIIAGFNYESKSAWCSGLCPIHPVEKFYGSGVAFSLPNAHCNECVKCSVPCPDSTINMTAQELLSTSSRATEILLVGGFPGYIWGWFHVPDYTGVAGLQNLYIVYGYPAIGASVTILIYLFLKRNFKKKKKLIINLFAAAGVSFYYWFRLPQLFGFSPLHTNGTLINLTENLPAWSMIILNIATSAFFLWWMVIRNKARRSWTIRPAYAANVQ